MLKGYETTKILSQITSENFFLVFLVCFFFFQLAHEFRLLYVRAVPVASLQFFTPQECKVAQVNEKCLVNESLVLCFL